MTERSRTIALAISLALNVFVIGAAAGGALMWHFSAAPRQEAPARGALAQAAAALPADEGKTFRNMLAAARKASASDIAAAKAGRQELAQLMTNDPLDRQAIDAELAAIRQADIALRARLEKAVTDFLATLTPADRRLFVAGLRGNGSILR
ncbi:MAG TPA: periplasmic heavy metal sensor [Devosia sp.]|nr:periplasmic heavy metal sensor [Devosia sp.]